MVAVTQPLVVVWQLIGVTPSVDFAAEKGGIRIEADSSVGYAAPASVSNGEQFHNKSSGIIIRVSGVRVPPPLPAKSRA